MPKPVKLALRYPEIGTFFNKMINIPARLARHERAGLILGILGNLGIYTYWARLFVYV